MWVRPLVDADGSCGGKAHGLARLIAAGLPVPDGFVVEAAAFQHVAPQGDTPLDDIGHRLAELAARIEVATLPDAFVRAVDVALARLLDGGHPSTIGALAVGSPQVTIEPALARTPSVAVRSSAALEDGAAGAAAGVFSSQTDVAGRDVWPAIRAVWTSALTPLAAAYARRREGDLAIAVIVQRSIPGARVTIYTRPPGRPTDEHAWIQCGDTIDVVARAIAEHATAGIGGSHDAVAAGGSRNAAGLPLEHARVAPGGSRDASAVPAAEHTVRSHEVLLELALAAERAIGAAEGADVELVVGEDRAWVVQARPIVHPRAATTRRPPPPIVVAALADGRTWTWDIAHNPDPLSPAQQGLVELVERAEVAPWSMRLCAGYLYIAPRTPASSAAVSTPGELLALAAELERRLAAEVSGEPGLAEALDRYVRFYRIWASELGPAITAARARTPISPGARVSAVERTLLRAAAGELDDAAVLRELGDHAPAWDVAVATYGERPDVVRAAIAHARRRLATDGAIAPTREARDLGEIAADLAERDDAWFARAQAMVRRAILARSRELGIAEDDACWLSLDDLIAGIDNMTSQRRASAARAAGATAAKWQMPLVVPACERSNDLNRDDSLRGIGTGGRVVGRVVRFGSLAVASGVGPGDVIVTRAVTPALAIFVVGCAALVSETGGPLDHGAAMARELSIPCVVGCRDAMTRLQDGMIITVDGDAGTVDIA